MLQRVPRANEKLVAAIEQNRQRRHSHSSPDVPKLGAAAREPVLENGEEPRIAHDHGEDTNGRSEPPLPHQLLVFTLSCLCLTIQWILSGYRRRLYNLVPRRAYSSFHRRQVSGAWQIFNHRLLSADAYAR